MHACTHTHMHKQKKKEDEEKDGGEEARAPAAAARASMDWMSAGGPIDFTGELRQVCLYGLSLCVYTCMHTLDG